VSKKIAFPLKKENFEDKEAAEEVRKSDGTNGLEKKSTESAAGGAKKNLEKWWRCG